MMRKGHLHAMSASVLVVCACASGKPMPAAEEIDAASNPDPVADARPDSMQQPIPDAPPPMPDACVPVATEHLMNPVFDLSPNGVSWTEVCEPGLCPLISANPTTLTAVSAPNKAWLGGGAGFDLGMASVTDSLYQDVTFPSNATTFVVSGYYVVASSEAPDGVYDMFTVDVVETSGMPIDNVIQLDNLDDNGSTAFVPFTKTISANLAGRTVRLRATSTNDFVNATSFFLDSLSFKATHCP